MVIIDESARPGTRPLLVRMLTREDIPRVLEIHRTAYPDYAEVELWDRRTLDLQIDAFPAGQLVAEYHGNVVGYSSSLIVTLDDSQPYTYDELTGLASFSSHDISGDTLYGADIAVHPDFRSRGISGELYDARKALMVRYNLRRMVAYGRLPGYARVSGKWTPEQYVTKVKAGILRDPALEAHLAAGYEVKRVLLDFLQDPSSLNHSTWLEMPNPEYDEALRKIAGPDILKRTRRVRVCSAQYKMRPLNSWEDFEQAVDFFVDSASTYSCHFLVLPELFTANLFSTFDRGLDDYHAIRRLAELTPRYLELFQSLAEHHNLYIVAGSHPVLREGLLYNVAHLFTPGGEIHTQDKLHITPAERELWDMEAGDTLRLFETPLGRIAIEICYDIEFPELTRLYTTAGVEIVFVPFSTDERKSYHRVRFCAQARAVENYIYVVMSGIVGNLPNVRSYLLNYGQAAVLTPSDFPFPQMGTAAEAEPNVETVVIAEMDLNTLAHQRENGTVRPLFDRRADLYDLHAHQRIEIIRVN